VKLDAGKPDEAREAWQRAAALGGDNEIAAKARQNLANLDARLAGRSAPVAQVVRPGPAPVVADPRVDVRPETDSGI